MTCKECRKKSGKQTLTYNHKGGKMAKKRKEKAIKQAVVIETRTVKQIKPEKKQGMIRQEDAAILRETLAWCFKHAPVQVQRKIHDALLRYSKAVESYCEHSQETYIAAEKRIACLDCGRRRLKTDLEIAK